MQPLLLKSLAAVRCTHTAGQWCIHHPRLNFHLLFITSRIFERHERNILQGSGWIVILLLLGVRGARLDV